MFFRTACITLTALIALANRGTESRAQYDLDRGYYLPPHANSGQPDRPASYGEGADEPGFGRAIRPGSPATGRNSGIVGSTRGDVGSLASLPPEVQPETGPAKELPNQLRRALIDYYTKEAAGTIIVDTPNTYLYFVLGNGKALRYGIGVGREGFTWSGSEKISRMAEWPDWNPPEQMIERQPYLPRFMAGGEGNPLGARALYLGDTLFRIHGTNQPSTIGTFVSSGCIRLTNEDITDLYKRVKVGTRVVVLSAKPDGTAAARASRRTLPPFTSGAISDPDPSGQKRKGDATTAKSQRVNAPVSGVRSSAVAHQTGTTENRWRSEMGAPKRENEAPRGSSQNTRPNEAGLVPNNPSPMQLKQETSAFEE